jgi:hypothetical protein
MTERICGGGGNGRFVSFHLSWKAICAEPQARNCADNARGTGSMTSVKLEIVSSLLSATVEIITFERATFEIPFH